LSFFFNALLKACFAILFFGDVFVWFILMRYKFNKKMPNYFKDIRLNPDKWFNIAFGLIGLPGTFMLLISNYKQMTVNSSVGSLDFFILLVYVGVIVAFLWSKRPIITKKPFAMGNTFSPFLPNENTVLWIRKKQKKALLEKINYMEGMERKIIVLMGGSGSGKSTLIKDIKDNDLSYMGFDCDYINNYKNLRDVSYYSKKRVIILDNFEIFFQEILTDRQAFNDKYEVDGRRKKIIDMFLSGAVVVIVIRDDKYYLLKVFGDMIPKLNEAVILEKVSLRNKYDYDDFFGVVSKWVEDIIDAGCGKVRNKNTIDGIVKEKSEISDDVPFFCHQVSLFELHCFCALLTQYDISGKDVSSVIGLHPKYVIKELIKECVNSSDDPELCVRVIYAILQHGRLKEKNCESSVYDIIDLIDATIDKDLEPIENVLSFLERLGLIKCYDKKYLLSYDALGDPIDLLAVDLLTYMERDSIRYLVESQEKKYKPKEVEEKKLFEMEDRIYYAVNAVIMLLVSFNFLHIPIDFLGFNNVAFWYNAHSFQGELNGNYLFIALPHLLWCNYVLLHYKKVYKYYDRYFGEKLLSGIIIFNLIICILVGIFLPQFWILSIGWGGLIQNIKTHVYSKDTRLSKITRENFSGRSNQTYVNMGVTFIIGLLFASLIPGADFFGLESFVPLFRELRDNFPEKYLMSVYYFISGLYIYAYIALYKDHISERKATIMRAELKRGVTL